MVALFMLFSSHLFAQFETNASTPIEGCYGAHCAVVADFNGDGKLDLAETFLDVQVFLGNGDGTFGTPTSYLQNIDGLALAIGDFNGDKKLDLAVADFSGLSILLGNGDGTFETGVTYSTACIPEFVGIGDFNNDGNMDLIASYSGGCSYVSIFFGNGDGTFQTTPVNTTPPIGVSAVGLGDFNRDGKLDIVIAEQFGGTSQVGIFLGNGDGTFSTGGTYHVGASPDSIAVGDFRKSGRLDLAVASLGGGTSILLGNGDGTFTPGQSFTTPGAVSAAAADFNGDGNVDLAVTMLDAPAGVDLLFGKGNGNFETPLLIRSGGVNAGVLYGDLNGDGKTDLLVLNTGSVAVPTSAIALLNTGVVTFSPPTPVNYGFLTVGSASPVQAVTLTNTGKQALSISSAWIGGPFHQINNCGHNVAAGATCDIRFTFTPTVTGSVSGSLKLIDNASSKPQIIELSGAGTWVNLSPLKLTFAEQKVGTSSPPQTVTLKNTGSTKLTVSGFQIFTHEFSETNNCTEQALAPGASCTIKMVFAPLHKGVRDSGMQVFDDGGASPQMIRMTGTGT